MDHISASRNLLDLNIDQRLSFNIPQQKISNWWNIKYYSKYFDVTVSLLASRISRSIFPFPSSSFFGELVPDLWGPFWISTTLIFLICAVGNIQATLSPQSWTPHVSLFGKAAGFIYFILTIVPIISYCLFQTFGNQVNFLHVLSLYGYSFSITNIGLLMCSYDEVWWRFIITLIAGLWKVGALIRNLRIEVPGLASGSLVYLLIIMTEIVIVLVINAYFFNSNIKNK